MSGKGGRTPGAGRKPGVPNKTTTQLREAILLAAEQAGGKGGLVAYLRTIAETNTSAYASLLGKVLPLQMLGAGPNGEFTFVSRVEREIVEERFDNQDG